MGNIANKIRLIKAIAKILGAYEKWFEIDFILRQFGMRNSDDWDAGSDREAYVTNMIEYADEAELQELHKFLIEESGGTTQESMVMTQSVEACWAEGSFRVFISHSSEDKDQVMALKNILSLYGVASFVAHEDIQPTSEWQEEILCGLETCHAVIAWATPDFMNSFWAQQEMGFSMSRRKLIVSVMNGSGPVGFISRQQGIRGLTSTRQLTSVVREIVDIFVRKSIHRQEIQDVLIKGFTNAYSFADSREKLALLERFSNWDEEKLDKLKAAVASNPQVGGSYGVPERIDGMYKKYLPQPEPETDEVTLADLPF